MRLLPLGTPGSARERLSSREGPLPPASLGSGLGWRSLGDASQGTTALLPTGEITWDAFNAEQRPSTSGSLAGLEARPSVALSQTGAQEVRPLTAASLLSLGSEAGGRPATGGSQVPEPGWVADAEDPMSRTQELLLAPVTEVDEGDAAHPELMATLDIPPPTPGAEAIQRRAYFLDGFSPRRLPPLTLAAKSKRFTREPPQVMVLETPPRSAGGERPLPQRQDVVGRPLAVRSQDKKSVTCPRLDSGPKSQTQLPKQPALPKKQPGGFYVGGKPLFGSKS